MVKNAGEDANAKGEEKYSKVPRLCACTVDTYIQAHK